MTRHRYQEKPPTGLDKAAFVALYGPVYEHSPWIAKAAYAAGLPADADSAEGLATALRLAVEAAGRDRQLALLRAHPDLAGRLALRGALTADSSAEQAGAGLDHCSPRELERFQTLNRAYGDKFGFPFILAVKGYRRGEILAIFERRLDNTPQQEFREALDQVHRIAYLRLCGLAEDQTARRGQKENS